MHNKGFTLIELMITVAVLAIVLSIAVPNFRDLTGNARLGAVTSDVVSVLKYARSEAVRRGDKIEVSPLGSSAQSNQWGEGLRVWVDSDGSNTFSEEKDIVLRVVEVSNDALDLTVANDASFDFNGRGETSVSASVTVNVCDDRTGETGRQITILSSGLVSVNSAYACL